MRSTPSVPIHASDSVNTGFGLQATGSHYSPSSRRPTNSPRQNTEKGRKEKERRGGGMRYASPPPSSSSTGQPAKLIEPALILDVLRNSIPDQKLMQTPLVVRVQRSKGPKSSSLLRRKQGSADIQKNQNHHSVQTSHWPSLRSVQATEHVSRQQYLAQLLCQSSK